jgi:hypothetical protein
MKTKPSQLKAVKAQEIRYEERGLIMFRPRISEGDIKIFKALAKHSREGTLRDHVKKAFLKGVE